MRRAGVDGEAAVGRRRQVGLGLIAAALLGVGARAEARAVHRPVVVELFTAQGCDDCSDADKLIGGLQQRRGVLGLSFSVDYFDYFGWKDTFAQPSFSERQAAYVKRLKVRDIYTPEVVVEGRAEAPGGDGEQVEALIRQAQVDRGSGAPTLSLARRGARVSVTGGRGSGELWLVRYDPRPQTVRVKGDDRKARAVTVYNAVRELTNIGAWRGRDRSLPLPAAKTEGLRTAVLLQKRGVGSILAVATD